jgi:CheY-like chemotaxis protein
VLHFIVEKALLYTRNPQVTIEVVEENSPERLSIKVDNIGMDIPQQLINFIRREQTRPLYETSNPILDAYPEIRTLLRNLNVLEGKIQFQTSPQLGEIAIISFSKQSVGHPDETEARVEAEIKHKSLKILIVEDDKINALILGLYLGDLVNVTTAFSGNEALNIIEMQYNQGVVYNLVLMDIGLPEPWNGVLLKTEIEKKWPEYRNVPFIAQTAHTHDSWAERIMNENFKGYLVKPLNRLDVLLHVNKFGL